MKNSNRTRPSSMPQEETLQASPKLFLKICRIRSDICSSVGQAPQSYLIFFGFTLLLPIACRNHPYVQTVCKPPSLPLLLHCISSRLSARFAVCPWLPKIQRLVGPVSWRECRQPCFGNRFPLTVQYCTCQSKPLGCLKPPRSSWLWKCCQCSRTLSPLSD